MPRHFTPSEANDELAHIRPLVEELVARRREQQRLAAIRVERATKVAGNGGGFDPRAVQEENEAEQRARVEIAQPGVHGPAHSALAGTIFRPDDLIVLAFKPDHHTDA